MRWASCVLLCLGAALVSADYQPTEWRWKGWTFQTGEDLAYGKTHTSYPLTKLFDGDASTAWVFSGLMPKGRANAYRKTNPEVDLSNQNSEYQQLLTSKPLWIAVVPSGKVTLDGIRIMNGYNKSEKAFIDNRRVLEVEIVEGQRGYGSEKPIKKTRLSDRMGWHTISLPKRRYPEGIMIRFTQLSDARTEDIALSELQLLKDGKPVDLAPTKVVAFTSGSECG